MTPFMTAVMKDQTEIADLLLKHNLATKGYLNRDGKSVLQMAEEANRDYAIAYLNGNMH